MRNNAQVNRGGAHLFLMPTSPRPLLRVQEADAFGLLPTVMNKRGFSFPLGYCALALLFFTLAGELSAQCRGMANRAPVACPSDRRAIAWGGHADSSLEKSNLFAPRRHDAIHPGIRDQLPEVLMCVVHRKQGDAELGRLAAEDVDLG